MSSTTLRDILHAFVRQHPKAVGALLPLMAIVPMQEVGLPLLYGRVLAAIVSPSEAEFRKTVAVAMATTASVHAGMLLRDAMNARVHALLQCFVRAELLERMLHQQANEGYDATSTGIEWMYLLSVVPELCSLWFRYVTDYIAPYLGTFAVAAVYLGRLDTALGATFVAFVGALFATFVHAPRACASHATDHAQSMGHMHDEIEAMLGGSNLEAVLASHHVSAQIVDDVRRRHHARHFEAYHRTGHCARRHRAAVLLLVVAFVA